MTKPECRTRRSQTIAVRPSWRSSVLRTVKRPGCYVARLLSVAFPQSAKRDQLELDLLVSLGGRSVATLGYAMPEVGATYHRAIELSAALGEKVHFPVVLSGSWVFHIVRGDLDTARRLAQQLIEFGSAEQSPAAVSAGDFTLGCTLFHLGQLELSHRQMDRTISMYDGSSHAVLSVFAGPDVGVFSRSYLAHLLWHRGFPDQALAAIQEAIATASRIEYPFSMAIALTYAALLCAFRRESKRHSSMLAVRFWFARSRSLRTIDPSPKLSPAGRPQ